MIPVEPETISNKGDNVYNCPFCRQRRCLYMPTDNYYGLLRLDLIGKCYKCKERVQAKEGYFVPVRKT